MLTQARLKEIVHYCSETGKFTWIMDRGGAWAGKSAGCDRNTKSGYIYIRIEERLYRAHRVAWLYVHGEWPTLHIDHINGVRDDNRIENLRLATQTQNLYNKRACKNSKTGVKGVCWDSSTGRYQVKISINGRAKHIGRYDSVEEGAAAYAEASRKHHGEFSRTA